MSASSRQAEARERTRRDLERRRRRAPDSHFWRSLALLGSVGWPVVLLATGGALLGRVLDLRWGTGVRLSVALLTLGALAGSLLAWRSVRGAGP